jgi:hypothetical protein
MLAWGVRVGAATTMLPPAAWYRVSSQAISWASVSSLPACREKSTANSRPSRSVTLSAMARAGPI